MMLLLKYSFAYNFEYGNIKIMLNSVSFCLYLNDYIAYQEEKKKKKKIKRDKLTEYNTTNVWYRFGFII